MTDPNPEAPRRTYIAERFDPARCDPSMKVHEVVLSQFDFPADMEYPVDVQTLYMPNAEQDRMREWCLDNLKGFQRGADKRVRREMRWAVFQWFPVDLELLESEGPVP